MMGMEGRGRKNGRKWINGTLAEGLACVNCSAGGGGGRKSLATLLRI